MAARKSFLKRLIRNLIYLIVAFLAFSACAYTGYCLRRVDMPVSARPRVPRAEIRDKRLVVPITLTRGVPAAEVGSFNDQLEAYLHFEFLRGREARDGRDTSRILLAGEDTSTGPRYKIFIVTDNNLLSAVPQLAELQGRNLIAGYEFETWTQADFYSYRKQSHAFDAAYDMPAEQKLEDLSSFQLLHALAQFLIFKSQTDNRVLSGEDPAVRSLTREQARQLAADILDVAHFYDLPLDYFLGVGAMENDYMDVDGDLTHAVWKKRAQPGDTVLRRTRRHVMVSDCAIGTWQITRETLRAAHTLYLRDRRDYSRLPAQLRPSRELDLNSLNDSVLTTYAGLLLRNLLDHFGGDVDKAMGAYNGGVRAPNSGYASGVKTVAVYARRILEHASGPDELPAPNRHASRTSRPRAASPTYRRNND